MPLEEIRSRLAPAAPAPAWDGLFSYWLSQDLAVREEGFLRLAAFEPRVDAEKNQYCEMLLKSYEGFGLSLPADSAVLPPQTPDQARRRRAAYSDLVQKGLLISLGSLFHIHKDSYEKAFAVFAELARSGPAEPGPYRDALGTSRKIAVTLLENFEKRGLAVKEGAGRQPRPDLKSGTKVLS
jgi:selenocysteine-specific elongation factor